ncbi:MAG TPA: TonB-dependent receptor, partial [Candidatus Synoicihabitans sp.]|nr:TonB-dependent receptor [Candidatus Synoicihabitans sp.]
TSAWSTALVVVGCLQHPVGASSARSLADLSIEELMNESVTSVAKKPQRIGDAAAAITVLSHDDLRRSGATNVPDALRLVPGMHVGAVNASQWAVSARGFNNLYANKLLVLVDGRTVYSPLFSGVYWDLQRTMLEDVERIEVIRGAGATVWGSNAVSGVVNIVTLGAHETLGSMIYGGGGSDPGVFGGVRYGGVIGDATYYRVFASYQANEESHLRDGQPAHDNWRAKHSGFRIDHHFDETSRLTWQADVTATDLDDDTSSAYDFNTLARWSRSFSARSTLEAQVYYDRTHRGKSTRAGSTTDTFDLAVQQTLGLGEHHDLIWGLGYRSSSATVGESSTLTSVRDGNFDKDLFSVFVQDEYQLVPERLTLTAGLKFEHNGFTGAEYQPSLRAVWKPAASQALWAAVSRAVRTPSALEGTDLFGLTLGPPIRGPGGGLYNPTLVGNLDLKSEIVWDYQLGWRAQLNRRASVDVAGFYSRFEDLITVGGITAFVPAAPVGEARVPWVNLYGQDNYGGEASLTVAPTNHWRLTASYALLLEDLVGSVSDKPSQPEHQFVLRSSVDLTSKVGIDLQLRHVSQTAVVPAHTNGDLRLSYRLAAGLEFALVGQNLMHSRSFEHGAAYYAVTSAVPRRVHAKVTWRF